MKKSEYIKAVGSLMKRSMKPRSFTETQLFKETIDNPEVDMQVLFEAKDVMQENELNQWAEGLIIGTVIGVGSFVLSGWVSDKLMDKYR